MEERKRQWYTDILEFLIVLGVILMIVTIYVPVAIWEEEQMYADRSHFYMQNIYNIETFFELLTDRYEEDGLRAMNVVNAIRDSLTADSTYLGDQILSLQGRNLKVNIPNGFDVEYDTTFGFQKSRRDTIIDTTVTVVTYSEELSMSDTIYIQKKALAKVIQDPSFREILDETPLKRVELISYYDTYMPDSTMFYCPLTKLSYPIKISESEFRVESPITETYKEPRYFIFSFTAGNHGFIDGGVRSWE